MDVTKHNFYTDFDDIVKSIEESTFLAIDTEFTGLNTGQCNQSAAFDTHAERYEKMKMGSSDFMLLQVGIATFKADVEKQKYTARPYNFYIFPGNSRRSVDKRFLCQSSSISFLIGHDFDFNKVFKEGIPYISLLEEMRLKAELEEKHAKLSSQNISCLFSPDGGDRKNNSVPVPDEHKEFIEDVSNKVKSYLDGDSQEALKLPPCNAFLRKLLYQTIESKFPQAHLETKGDKRDRHMEVRKPLKPEELQLLNYNREMTDKMELDILVGFTKVMRAVSESGKLVIGHNMFLDVFHCLSHFFSPLPDSLDEFKASVHLMFPKLLDTKLMANTSPFKEHFLGTSLEELRFSFQHPPFKPAKIDLDEGFQKYSTGESFHEAGYDAYMTGYIFATLTNFLGGYQNPPTPFMLPTEQCGVEPFFNKIFMMRMADIQYLNISGSDVEVKRDHIFHVTFPMEWKASDLNQLFLPYGNVQISWLTSTTAYVGLFKRENAKEALEDLQSDSSVFRVVPFATFHKEQPRCVVAPPTPSTPHWKLSDLLSPHVRVKRKSDDSDSGTPVVSKMKKTDSKDASLALMCDLSEDLGTVVSKEEQLNDKGESNHAKSKVTSKNKLFEESDQW